MLVLEPTRTDWSSDDKHFDTKGMVTQLKNSKASDGTHHKLIIAYIDIGEAENWRRYWDPSWPDWNCEGDPPQEWPDYVLACDPDGYDWQNESDPVNYYVGCLDQYLASGPPVCDCEYALAHADTACANAYARGYVPYVTRRSLSCLTTTPPPSYWPGSDMFRHIRGATCND
jgi:endo-alpha-1,4-polygalactosaminidase (GH114 family)